MAIVVPYKSTKPHLKPRVTREQKERKDFERAKEMMDTIDTYYGGYRDYERIDKFKINFDLLNGRLDVKLYDDPLCFEIQGEEISFDYQNVSHTPLISQISNAIVGEVANRPFKLSIVDHSPTRLTIKKQAAGEAIVNYLQSTIIPAKRDSIILDLMKQAGETDIFMLAKTPEEQLQLEAEINRRLQEELPRDITEFVADTWQSPEARQGQKMLDYITKTHKIRQKTIRGFKNSAVTGEEYYFGGDYNGRLLFEDVNPIYFTWGGGDRDNEWSQRADWCKREKWLSYQAIVGKHSELLKNSDYKALEVDVEPIGGFREFWDPDNPRTKRFMYTWSYDEGLQQMYPNAGYKTKEGRSELFKLYAAAMEQYGEIYGDNISDYGIRETHFQWRDLRKMYKVERNIEGRRRTFYLDESYEPTWEDEEVEEIWVHEGWEGYKLGTFEPIYVGIRRIPYQYKSLNNPHHVDLSYYGKRYNTHDNTVKNMSLVDLGKSDQKSFDLVMASIKHDMATNFGNVFMLFLNLKPENLSWQDWLDTLRNANILLADPHRHGLNGIDPQFLKSINMSKISDIAGKLQLAQQHRQSLASSMYFNEARIGALGQYANTTNIEQNSTASYNQTTLYFEQHDEIVSEAVMGFLNRSRHYYRENPDEAAIFLDDISLAHLMSAPAHHFEWFGVGMDVSTESIRKLNQLKAQTVNFIQNPESLQGVASLIFADTQSEVHDIINRESKRLEVKRQEDMQFQMEQTQAALQAKAAEKQAEMAHESAETDKKLRSQEQRTVVESQRYAMANDLNQNQQSDFIEKAMLEIQAKLKMHDDEMALEKEKLRLKEKLERESI